MSNLTPEEVDTALEALEAILHLTPSSTPDTADLNTPGAEYPSEPFIIRLQLYVEGTPYSQVFRLPKGFPLIHQNPDAAVNYIANELGEVVARAINHHYGAQDPADTPKEEQ